MFEITFELNDGSNYTVRNGETDDDSDETHHDLGEAHPVFSTEFVADLVENHDVGDGEDAPLTIPLPAFIEIDAFVQFCNHLLHYKLSTEDVGFGMHSDLSYRGVYNQHLDYIEWAQEQENPSGRMAALLDWVETIDTVRESWRTSGRDILRIAQFFLVDLCSNCGRKSTDMDDVQLDPCHRTSWPNVPTIPVYDNVVQGLDEGDETGRRRAWREAWDAAERDAGANGRTVCTNNDLLCSTCISNSATACRTCNAWECESCQQDNEISTLLERLHDEDPRIEVGDDGIRGNPRYPPHQKLQPHPCLVCRRRICHGCGTECSECHRRACSNCKYDDDLNLLCEECRDRESDEDDDNGADGMINRDEWICRQCFDREEHFCSCGEPSYDPNAVGSYDEDEAYLSSGEDDRYTYDWDAGDFCYEDGDFL